MIPFIVPLSPKQILFMEEGQPGSVLSVTNLPSSV